MQQSLTIASATVKRRFWFFLALAILSVFFMRFWSDGLSSSEIIDFEIAKNSDRANDIMSKWTEIDRTRFLRSIYADFIFILGYGGALFYGCRFMGRLSGHMIFKKAGYFFSFLALIAAVCDVLENIGMLFTIRNSVINWVVHFTYDMALVKFSLIFITVFFIVVCLFFRALDTLGTKKMKLGGEQKVTE